MDRFALSFIGICGSISQKRIPARSVNLLRSDCLFAIETLPGMACESGIENSLSPTNLE